MLDAGSGIHRLSDFGAGVTRVDVLLSHLHMDHILGLGFFGALFQPDLEVHIWGPPSATFDLRARLSRYLSPPLFPVRLADLPCRLELHDVPRGTFDSPARRDRRSRVPSRPHARLPGRRRRRRRSPTSPTTSRRSATRAFPNGRRSGRRVSRSWPAPISSSTTPSTPTRSTRPTSAGATARSARPWRWPKRPRSSTLAAFHHDPSHNDGQLDRLFSAAVEERDWSFEFSPAREGSSVTLGRHPALQP